MKNIFKFLFLYVTILGGYANAEHIKLTVDEQNYITMNPTVRVHNELNWMPFNFNSSGEPKGYSIDYMSLVGEKLGLNIEYVYGPDWSEFLGMMQDKTLDIMVNIASTAERRNYLSFTEPYLFAHTSLFVRTAENSISDLDGMAGKKIAFTEGFFFEEFIRKYYPKIEVVTFESTLASFVGVADGLADAAIEVTVVGKQILDNAKISSIKSGGKISDPRFITTFTIATNKENQILKDIIQKGMDAITLIEGNQIRKKWKIDATESSLLSIEDMGDLELLNKLRVCVNPDYLPLEATDVDGKLTGISSEFVKILDSYIHIPLEIVQTTSWEDSLQSAKSGQCDLIPMVVKSEPKESYLNFTSPWLTVPIAVATRQNQIYISNIEQLIGKKIGVVYGLATKDTLLKANHGIELVEVPSVNDGLKLVNDGALFGFIDTVPVISRALQTEPLSKVKISGSLGLGVNFAIGVNAENTRLLNIMERIVSTIDKEQVLNIYNRWLAIAYIERFDYTRFWQVLIGTLLIVLFILYRFKQTSRIAAKLKIAQKEVEEVNQKLMQQARTDILTGISNRLGTDEFLTLEQDRFKRYDITFSVILLDIDFFKHVNDNYGHLVGDEVLKEIAKCLDKNTRKNDHIGRWGGEEFIIICSSTSLTSTLKLAEILRSEIMNNIVEDLPSITASFGVAAIESGDSVQELIKRADDALYRAKGEGRNCIAF